MKKYNLFLEKTEDYKVKVLCNEVPKAVEVFRDLLKMEREAQEVFAMISLDTKKNVIGVFEVSRGAVDKTIVEPAEVFKRALLSNAHTIIVGHNHPSGDPKPSIRDIGITDKLRKVGENLGIEIIDHVIIGDGCYYSFLEEGLI